MRAIVLSEFGGIDKLLMTELPVPQISDDEVLLKVKAISINPVDVRTRSGSAMASHLKDNVPLILGWDVSGIVVAKGKNVSGVDLNDEVFGMVNFLGHGKGYAEYLSAPISHITRKPSNISHEEAAAATLAALTAWQLINNYAKVKSGDRILIQGASGGVGHYAVQIAKHLKAHVIGVSSARNRDFVLSLGADEHIAYDLQRFEDVAHEVDFVVDAFANTNLDRSLKVVKRGGTILSLLPMISEDVLKKAKDKEVDIHYALVKSSGADMQIIAELLGKGILKSHVSKVFEFAQMGDAHLEVEKGKTVGKTVIRVGSN